MLIIAIAFFSQWSGNGLVSYYLNAVFTTIGITNTTIQLMITGYAFPCIFAEIFSDISIPVFSPSGTCAGPSSRRSSSRGSVVVCSSYRRQQACSCSSSSRLSALRDTPSRSMTRPLTLSLHSSSCSTLHTSEPFLPAPHDYGLMPFFLVLLSLRSSSHTPSRFCHTAFVQRASTSSTSSSHWPSSSTSTSTQSLSMPSPGSTTYVIFVFAIISVD